MIPDRKIVRKLKEYDRNLFVKWNERREYFELWMKHWDGGSVLITPITQSIYKHYAPVEYAPLDERILMWVYHADSEKNSKHGYIETMKAWKEFQANQIKSRRDDNRHRAAELFHTSRNFFMTKGSHNRNMRTKDKIGMLKPDLQSSVRNRIFQRSRTNAKVYNYGPK